MDIAEEKNRLAILRNYNILKNGNLESYNRLLELAMCIVGADMGAICILEENHIIHKSLKNLPEDKLHSIYPLGRVILDSNTPHGEFVHIDDPDTIAQLCSQSPSSDGLTNIDNFVGIPLFSATSKIILGTICLLNREHVELSSRQINSLRCVADQVVAHFDIHNAILEIGEQRKELDKLRDKKHLLLREAKHIRNT